MVLEAKGKVNNAFKKKKKISSGKPKPKEVLTPKKSKRILEGKVYILSRTLTFLIFIIKVTICTMSVA